MFLLSLGRSNFFFVKEYFNYYKRRKWMRIHKIFRLLEVSLLLIKFECRMNITKKFTLTCEMYSELPLGASRWLFNFILKISVISFVAFIAVCHRECSKTSFS